MVVEEDAEGRDAHVSQILTVKHLLANFGIADGLPERANLPLSTPLFYFSTVEGLVLDGFPIGAANIIFNTLHTPSTSVLSSSSSLPSASTIPMYMPPLDSNVQPIMSVPIAQPGLLVNPIPQQNDDQHRAALDDLAGGNMSSQAGLELFAQTSSTSEYQRQPGLSAAAQGIFVTASCQIMFPNQAVDIEDLIANKPPLSVVRSPPQAVFNRIERNPVVAALKFIASCPTFFSHAILLYSVLSRLEEQDVKSPIIDFPEGFRARLPVTSELIDIMYCMLSLKSPLPSFPILNSRCSRFTSPLAALNAIFTILEEESQTGKIAFKDSATSLLSLHMANPVTFKSKKTNLDKVWNYSEGIRSMNEILTDRFSIVTVNERVHVPSQRNHIAGTFVAGLMELTNDKGVMGVEDPWVDMGQGTSGNAYFVYPWCGMTRSDLGSLPTPYSRINGEMHLVAFLADVSKNLFKYDKPTFKRMSKRTGKRE